jgi:hypothetical protein
MAVPLFAGVFSEYGFNITTRKKYVYKNLGYICCTSSERCDGKESNQTPLSAGKKQCVYHA